MHECTYEDGGRTFIRVNKIQARNAYNAGQRIVLCPCNLRPGYPWHHEVSISGQAEASFEQQVNAFSYYNLNHEAGRYPAYFVEKR